MRFNRRLFWRSLLEVGDETIRSETANAGMGYRGVVELASWPDSHFLNLFRERSPHREPTVSLIGTYNRINIASTRAVAKRIRCYH